MNLRAFDRLTILMVVLMFGTATVTFADGVRKRIKFPRGRTSTVINNAVLRDEIDQYILNARAGQKMKVDISSVEDTASFQIVSCFPEPALTTTQNTGTENYQKPATTRSK